MIRSRAALIAIIIIPVAIASFVVVTFVRSRLSESSRVPCAENLRGIGVAIYFFATKHSGQLPDSLEQLVSSGEITRERLFCPDSREPYIYLRKGSKLAELDPNDIVAYDNPTNHGEGVNVLAADDHTEWLTTGQLQAALRIPRGQLTQFHR